MTLSEAVLVIILGAIAIGAVLFPLLVGRERYEDGAALDADIRRYRAALEADTVCGRCKHANPADARFCANCGRALDD